MEDLITEYEKTRAQILQRIRYLTKSLKDEHLPTRGRERIGARIDCLRTERYEMMCVINDMRRRY